MPFLGDTSDTQLPAETQESVEGPPITMPASSVDVEPSNTGGTSDGSETTLVDGFVDGFLDDSSSESSSTLDTLVSTDGVEFHYIGAHFDLEHNRNCTGRIDKYPSLSELNAHLAECAPASSIPFVSNTEPSTSYPYGDDDGDYDLSLSISSSETLAV